MKTLALVRTVVFALLLAYTLYAMPWKYLDLIFFERGGMLLPAQEVLHNLRPLVIAAWIAVAWIGLDSWLSIAVWRRELRRAHEAGTEAASALPAKAARE